ncbi:MAG: primosomal protein N' [Candidatus Omnitrophica bacterium]|nr:primosomal protein N' [Candidatus Omnitrophota bacterium]
MSSPKYAEVAVGLPVRSTFHYAIPRGVWAKATVGTLVWVPFRNRRILGVIVGLVEKPEVPRVKPIAETVGEEPLISRELLELTRWISETYQAGWGETLLAALPGPLRRGRTRMESREALSTPEAPRTLPFQPTPEQASALEKILPLLRQKKHQIFLLHGVTGSGKTEVYLQAIAETLAQGRSSIVLVPEISLTPQAIERFQGRFGKEEVALLHSGMLESHRLSEWNRIRRGSARVVVGARSAVFAPVSSLGLVVVDEEHEPSYKQEDSPRYHAREAAIRRAALNQAAVILGSATPALETYRRALQGEFTLIRLPHRIERVPLPEVKIVDMRREWASGRRGGIFSKALEEAIAQTLKDRQQGILFLNRRGFSTSVQCRRCGHTLRCKSCQVSLVYHIAKREMICHTCRASSPAPQVCPPCRSEYVRFQGMGTQRVESELSRLFPHASIARMDTDSTRSRGSHDKLLRSFRRHEIDFLVGTQMIAKGLDFPRVTLVGIISADTALNLPDFRSAERTFNLLTQVAGRSGRGELPGRVIVQTYTPHHYAIQAAGRHDYEGFYAQEIKVRREVNLPPFSRLIQILVRSMRESKAIEGAGKLRDLLREELGSSVTLLGPSPHPIRRVRRVYRWQILLKAPSLDLIQEALTRALRKAPSPRGCVVSVDVDPLS